MGCCFDADAFRTPLAFGLWVIIFRRGISWNQNAAESDRLFFVDLPGLIQLKACIHHSRLIHHHFKFSSCGLLLVVMVFEDSVVLVNGAIQGRGEVNGTDDRNQVFMNLWVGLMFAMNSSLVLRCLVQQETHVIFQRSDQSGLLSWGGPFRVRSKHEPFFPEILDVDDDSWTLSLRYCHHSPSPSPFSEAFYKLNFIASSRSGSITFFGEENSGGAGLVCLTGVVVVGFLGVARFVAGCPLALSRGVFLVTGFVEEKTIPDSINKNLAPLSPVGRSALRVDSRNICRCSQRLEEVGILQNVHRYLKDGILLDLLLRFEDYLSKKSCKLAIFDFVLGGGLRVYLKDGDRDGKPHKGVKASAKSDVKYSFTSAQDGEPLQDDYVRLCLRNDLKKAQDHTCNNTNQKLSVGVVSPYASQVVTIQEKITHQYEKLDGFSVEVKSIDGVSGWRQDIINLSTVRSNSRGSVGFQSSLQRTNVALTRARHSLWILGNERTLTSNDIVGVKKELDQLDDLANGNSSLFKDAKWKV
ncbi:UvrD-like helicase, ATP-binding domain, P-loop containing nucleoside triphosphate hydrolase [Tanacetum coccineum]